MINQEQHENPSVLGWQILARAYALVDDLAYSYYAAAEYNFALANIEGAKKQLLYAVKSNPNKQLSLKIADLKKRMEEE